MDRLTVMYQYEHSDNTPVSATHSAAETKVDVAGADRKPARACLTM